MAWLRLDDKRALHPKCRAAGMAASGLDVVAMCWSSHQELDGFISCSDLQMLAEMYWCSDWNDLAARLVEVGRWREDKRKNGYVIRDYLDYNPSHAELEARRKADRERKRSRDGIHTDSARNPSGVRKDSAAKGRGYKGVKLLEETAPDFDDFWAVYPKRVAKEAARKAFSKALATASPVDIIDGARRYRDDPKRKDDYTAHAATWLNACRWEDEPAKAPVSNAWFDHHGNPVGA